MIDGGAVAEVSTTNCGDVSQKREAATAVSTCVSPPTRVKGAATGLGCQTYRSNKSPTTSTATAARRAAHLIVRAHRDLSGGWSPDASVLLAVTL
jgi:hypothetical protein